MEESILKIKESIDTIDNAEQEITQVAQNIEKMRGEHENLMREGKDTKIIVNEIIDEGLKRDKLKSELKTKTQQLALFIEQFVDNEIKQNFVRLEEIAKALEDKNLAPHEIGKLIQEEDTLKVRNMELTELSRANSDIKQGNFKPMQEFIQQQTYTEKLLSIVVDSKTGEFSASYLINGEIKQETADLNMLDRSEEEIKRSKEKLLQQIGNKIPEEHREGFNQLLTPENIDKMSIFAMLAMNKLKYPQDTFAQYMKFLETENYEDKAFVMKYYLEDIKTQTPNIQKLLAAEAELPERADSSNNNANPSQNRQTGSRSERTGSQQQENTDNQRGQDEKQKVNNIKGIDTHNRIPTKITQDRDRNCILLYFNDGSTQREELNSDYFDNITKRMMVENIAKKQSLDWSQDAEITRVVDSMDGAYLAVLSNLGDDAMNYFLDYVNHLTEKNISKLAFPEFSYKGEESSKLSYHENLEADKVALLHEKEGLGTYDIGNFAKWAQSRKIQKEENKKLPTKERGGLIGWLLKQRGTGEGLLNKNLQKKIESTEQPRVQEDMENPKPVNPKAKGKMWDWLFEQRGTNEGLLNKNLQEEIESTEQPRVQEDMENPKPANPKAKGKIMDWLFKQRGNGAGIINQVPQQDVQPIELHKDDESLKEPEAQPIANVDNRIEELANQYKRYPQSLFSSPGVKKELGEDYDAVAAALGYPISSHKGFMKQIKTQTSKKPTKNADATVNKDEDLEH